jgi:hypothetical protein
VKRLVPPAAVLALCPPREARRDPVAAALGRALYLKSGSPFDPASRLT